MYLAHLLTLVPVYTSSISVMNKNTISTLLSDNNAAINTINCSFDKLNNTIYLQNSINIFTMNICSIKKHFDELPMYQL